MDRELIIRDLMYQEVKRCNNLHARMVDELEKLPDGSLTCRDNRIIAVIRDKEKIYNITVLSEDDIVSDLRKRKFIKKGISILEHRIHACETFIKRGSIYDPVTIESELKEHYHGEKLFLEGDLNPQALLMGTQYINPIPFNEEHFTSNGVKCRSKSEALIGTRLEQRGLLYLCDTGIELDCGTRYPDFKILLPKRRRLIYLEHFGMIDKPGYAKRAFKKMEEYERNGIYLGFNFFYTYETRDDPLNMKRIDEKIDEILELDSLRPKNWIYVEK